MNPQAHPHNASAQQQGAGIGLDDIYFTVFRHKMILLVCLCLGFVAAVVVRLTTKATYSSHAKLLVRYVVETQDVPVAPGSSIHEADQAGASIMNSEVEILTSHDLAMHVAETVGPEKILGSKDATNLVEAAAKAVSGGVEAVVSGRSDVMVVNFNHPDREVVRPVLAALIEAYRHKHYSVYQGLESGEDYYSDQLVQFRKRLAENEEELKRLLTQAKVMDVAQAKKTYGEQIQKLRNDLLAAKLDLTAKRAAMGEDTTSNTNINLLESPIPTDKLDYYSTVLAGLEDLRKRERLLLIQFKEAHPQVTATRESIAQLKQTKAELEQEYPGLALSAISSSASSGVDQSVERAQIRALAAKVASYEGYLTNLQVEAFNLMDLEPRIAELERQHDQEAKNLAYVSGNLDKARLNQDNGNKVTGIKNIEEPTPPLRNNKKAHKMMGIVFGVFLGLGFGIAFLIDFVVDRTVKRSADVRRHMRLPFFLAIPNTCWKAGLRLPRLGFNKSSSTGEVVNGDATNGAVTSVTPPWDHDHHLRLYAEGLRERLLTYFEVNSMNHKPKLVGVTSCGEGAGVTTLASGVAAALSKTGDGNVLLVDMNDGHGSTHSFYKGKPGCGLADALEPDSRADAQVQENLYMVTLRPSDTPGSTDGKENSNKLLPSRFNRIMPQLKASDYDYVIFDMPPVTPTSVTPRLSTTMDMVLLVLESEKTAQQVASQAGTLLAEAQANAAVVLNKCRRHVPAVLSQEM